jgi:hypothetical protein
MGESSAGKSGCMTLTTLQDAVEAAFRRSLSWLAAHRHDFSFQYEGAHRDQLLLLKPFAEYVLTVDILRGLGIPEPALAECMAEAWLDTAEGDALLAIALTVTACKANPLGLQTRAFMDQHSGRIRQSAGQHSVHTSQHSYANGLQTRVRANHQCEWQNHREINAFMGTPCFAAV